MSDLVGPVVLKRAAELPLSKYPGFSYSSVYRYVRETRYTSALWLYPVPVTL